MKHTHTHTLTVKAVISMMVSQNARLEMTPVGAVSTSWQEKQKTHTVHNQQTSFKHSLWSWYKAIYCVYNAYPEKSANQLCNVAKLVEANE